MLVIAAYPSSQSGLIFSHASHITEQNIDCATCHNIVTSASSADKNIPGHDVCSQCHSIEKAPEDCILCHINPENPAGVTLPAQELLFSHRAHLKTSPTSQECLACHSQTEKATLKLTSDNYPAMEECFRCHNSVTTSSECKVCHTRPQEMKQLVHPPDWKHSHKFQANSRAKNCGPCHQAEAFCSDCHAGDNLVETVHGLNYRYNHALDARSKEFECQSCHNYQDFCVSCHMAEGSEPLDHNLDWVRNPLLHADAARKDIESCAGCHDTGSPTCARAGCHSDTDGLKGTNPSIHDASIDDLGHGPWHSESSFECFQCHTDTHQAGVGFCGYCHGGEVEE
jgi:hypothetical protein